MSRNRHSNYWVPLVLWVVFGGITLMVIRRVPGIILPGKGQLDGMSFTMGGTHNSV